MDQPEVDADAHRQALTALGRASTVSLTARSLWNPIRHVAASSPERPLRIVDLACGGGHVALALARLAARARLPVDIVGCDVSPVAIAYAQNEAERRGVRQVRFVKANVLDNGAPVEADVVCCSLFLHHLDETEAVVLLRRMAEAAKRLVIVSDLQRSEIGFLYAWVGCRLLSRSRIFHVDGQRSVEAAFTAREAGALGERAGLSGARIIRTWPQRWLLEWRRAARS